MQTAELVAGRELDALVAEKVMGWLLVRDFAFAEGEYWAEWIDSSGGLQAAGAEAKSAGFPASTDIAAAWRVVAHLAGGSPRRYSQIGAKQDGWEAQIWTHCDLHGDRCESVAESIWVTADTAPLAICRAALAAVDA